MTKTKNKIFRDGFTWPQQGEYSLLYDHLYAEDSIIVGSRRNEMLRLMFIGFCCENGLGSGKVVSRSGILNDGLRKEGRLIGKKTSEKEKKTKSLRKIKDELYEEDDLSCKKPSKTSDKDSVIENKINNFDEMVQDHDIVAEETELCRDLTEKKDDDGSSSSGFEFDPEKYCT